MQIKEIAIERLIEYADNPRNNDTAVEAVANSIEEFGFKVPLVIDKNYIIVAGHTRLKAAKRLGLTKVPCIIADDLNEEQIKAFRLADNKVGELATWDFEKLNAELEGIADIDMTAFGFEALAEELTADEDEVPEVEEEEPPITQEGDIWVMGNHRLICGDSTDPDTIARLMDGATADLYLTDPPYNVALGMNETPEEAAARNRRTDGKIVQNDSMSDSEFFSFLLAAFKAAESVLRPGGGFYIWHADSEGLNFRRAAKESGLDVKQCLIWNKNSLVMGRQDYQWKHEPCLYGWKPGAAHYFVNDRTIATVFEDKPNINKMSKDELKAYIKELLEPAFPTTIINEDKPARSDDHPTMKPVKLFGRLIQNSTKRGELVLDTFGGSGTTLAACEQLDRICYIAELDPRYCDVIVKRWEKLSGEKAERI